ncbi:hypothetical protein [Mycoplasmopsis californica]|nr:hypothetical protein [Mycoplasmopsis californica]
MAKFDIDIDYIKTGLENIGYIGKMLKKAEIMRIFIKYFSSTVEQ